MRFGSFEMPSKEWIEKYGDTLRVWIVGQSTPDERDRNAYLVWDGFTFIEGQLPEEALTGFPYVRMSFTENWKIIIDDTPGANSLKILHADGSVFQFDRTNGSEKVVFEDKVLKHKQEWTKDKMLTADAFGNTISMTDKGVKINDEYVVLQPTLDWILNNASAFVMGNMSVPAPIMPSVVTEGNQGVSGKKSFVSNR